MADTMRDGAEVSATITAAEAARIRWQAVVVGAGPAGAAAAWRLAAAGIRVLLLDRDAFPRGKVCGCCLSTRALNELRMLGQGSLPAAAVELESVRVIHRGRALRVSLPAGSVVSRELLDATLVRRAIAAGCHWLPAASVQSLDDHGGGADVVSVRLAARGWSVATGLEIETDMAVVATGLSHQVRIGPVGTVSPDHRRIAPGSRFGVGAVLPASACDLPAGELVMAVGRDGYCGLVRLEDGRIDVAAAIDRTAISRGADPASTVAGLLEQAAAGEPTLRSDAAAIREGSFRATPPLTCRAPLVAGAARRILRVGDAAGYVEPFTGEGIGWSLAAARILATAALGPSGLRPPDEVADRYVAAQRRELSACHVRCRVVAGGLRRPAVVATAIAAARTFPSLARRVVPMVIGASFGGGGR